jgi:hypothetical protein
MGTFNLPFYRLKITERSRSAQHDMLLALDNGSNQVFYTAPRFHTVTELNAAYLAAEVCHRSFYIRPRDIGRLDDDAHHIAFDETTYRLCSEPREVKGIRGDEFPAALRNRRIADDRPLRNGPLDDVLSHVDNILRERSLPTDIADGVLPGGDSELRKLISPYGILGPNFSSCRIHPQQGELDDGEIGRAARASKTKSS